jgi:hypothetical protein
MKAAIIAIIIFTIICSIVFGFGYVISKVSKDEKDFWDKFKF